MKRVLPALFVLALLLAFAAPALAHALLLRSDPPANAALAQPPVQVQLWLTEPVEPAFSEIKVFDSAGIQVDDGASRVDPADLTQVRVGLRTIGDGVYTVSWRALSTVDGHVTVGSFPFAVGNFDAARLEMAEAASSQTTSAGLGEVLPRWLALLGAALAVGGFIFTAYVWAPGWREVGRRARPGRVSLDLLFLRARRAGLALFLAASIGGLLRQAHVASGLAPAATVLTPALGNLLFNTRYGLLWLGRLLFALVLLISEKRWEGWLRYVQPPAAAGMLLMLSLNSHAAAAPNPFAPVFSDWLHLLAAGVWVGGLAHLALSQYATRNLDAADRTQLAAGIVPRFSNLGLASVLTLLGSGLYNSRITVGTFGALFATEYGRGLLAKLWIIVPLIGLAGINLLVLRPALQAQREAGPAGGRSLARHLMLTVAGETALAACVLYAAASFATIPPARTLSGQRSFNAPADDLRVRLIITPGRVGMNRFDVRLADQAGQPVADATDVRLRFSLLSGDVPVGTEAPLAHQGEGVYAAEGTYLSLPGEWQTLVVVRRAAKFDSFATFRMQMAAPGAAPASDQARVVARWAALLLFTVGLLFVFALRGLTRSPVQQAFLGIVPALALALAGIVVFRSAAAGAPEERVNPIPPSEASLAQGQASYQQHCLACHGPSGLGDGPAALLMNPRPADLQQHMIPGVHTDGQIFEWISNGYPGSVMPAFHETLTEEERWHVLNYIRTLVPNP